MALKNIYWPYAGNRQTRPGWQRLFWHVIDISNPCMKKQVRDCLAALQPDLVCTQNLQGFSYGIWSTIRQAGLPLVHVLHDFALLCPRTTLYRRGRLCRTGQARCAECRALTACRPHQSRQVDAVVGVSRFILDIHLAHGLFPQARKQVIYNALEEGHFTPPSPGGLPREGLSIGFLGRVTPDKGIHILLEAAEILRQRHVRIRLWVAGRTDAGDVAGWQNRYPELEIHWLGHVPPDQLWPLIDVLAFPSASYEALGNVVLEAASAGVPSVVSNHGGAPELLVPGVTGLLFVPNDPMSLANAMDVQQQNPQGWRHMGERARQHARGFMVDSRIEAFELLFQSLLSGNGEERA